MNTVLTVIFSIIEHGVTLLIEHLKEKSDAQLTNEALARLASITGKLKALDDLEAAEQAELDAAVPPPAD